MNMQKLILVATVLCCFFQATSPATAQRASGMQGQRGNIGRKHPRLAKLIMMRRAQGGGQRGGGQRQF
jgi:hypothetical protein